MPFANFKFPQGLLNEKQKEEIIHKTTNMFAGYCDEGVGPYSMVLIDEVVDGGCSLCKELRIPAPFSAPSIAMTLESLGKTYAVQGQRSKHTCCVLATRAFKGPTRPSQ